MYLTFFYSTIGIKLKVSQQVMECPLHSAMNILVLQSCTVTLTAEHSLCSQTAVQSADLPPVCSESGLTAAAGASEGNNVGVEEVVHMQREEDHLAVALSAFKCADKVCYVCNNVMLTVAHVCTVACAFWQCVVWCLGVTVM
jgi:hypothetical protein